MYNITRDCIAMRDRMNGNEWDWLNNHVNNKTLIKERGEWFKTKRISICKRMNKWLN